MKLCVRKVKGQRADALLLTGHTPIRFKDCVSISDYEDSEAQALIGILEEMEEYEVKVIPEYGDIPEVPDKDYKAELPVAEVKEKKPKKAPARKRRTKR